jgi:hypothetical protein
MKISLYGRNCGDGSHRDTAIYIQLASNELATRVNLLSDISRSGLKEASLDYTGEAPATEKWTKFSKSMHYTACLRLINDGWKFWPLPVWVYKPEGTPKGMTFGWAIISADGKKGKLVNDLIEYQLASTKSGQRIYDFPTTERRETI